MSALASNAKVEQQQLEPTVDPWSYPPITTFQLPHPDYPGQGHTAAVYSIQLAGQYVISCGADKSIRIWDLPSQQLVKALEAHTGSVVSAWYNEDTDAIISGGVDQSLIIWRFSTGDIVMKIEKAHDGSVLSVRCDARYMVSASRDRFIKLWDSKDYSLKWMAQHPAAVNSVRLSDNCVVSGCGGSIIRVWKIENGELIRSIEGHTRGITALEVFASGIVSSSSDSTVRIWDETNGKELECLKEQQNLVRDVALGLHAGKHAIVSGSYDGTIIGWKRGVDEQWRVKLKLYYKIAQQNLVGDLADTENLEGNGKVFSVQFDDQRIICSGEAKKIVGWEFGISA